MTSQEKLQTAMQYAMANRPAVGGFPFLAECLRAAGVVKNLWALPSTQSVYVMKEGTVVYQGTPLVSGMHDVPPWSEEALVQAIRTDQEGKSTFPEFLTATWNAGVVHYEVDFHARTVSYAGARGERYTEAYPGVTIEDPAFLTSL